MKSNSESKDPANSGDQLNASIEISGASLLLEHNSVSDHPQLSGEKTADTMNSAGATPNPQTTVEQKIALVSSEPAGKDLFPVQVPTGIENPTAFELTGVMEEPTTVEPHAIAEDIQVTQHHQQGIHYQPTSHQGPENVDQQLSTTEQTDITTQKLGPAANRSQPTVIEQQLISDQRTAMAGDKSSLPATLQSKTNVSLNTQNMQPKGSPPTATLATTPLFKPIQPRVMPLPETQHRPASKLPHLLPANLLGSKIAHPKPKRPKFNGSLANSQNTTSNDQTAPKFTCPLPNCGRAYNTPVGLRNHKIAAHPESFDRQYACHVEGCGKIYSTTTTLNVHVRKAHPGEVETFVCELDTIAEGDETAGNGEKGNGERISDDEPREGKKQCGKVMEGSAALKTHQRSVHGVWKCGVGTCDWRGHNKHTLGAHRKKMHKPKNPAPVATATKEPPKASEPKESEPTIIKKQGGKGARREPIVSNLSKERVESDLSSENEEPKATEVMVFKETEKIIKCFAPDCKHQDVTEWGLRRHWMAAHHGLPYPVSTPSQIAPPVAPIRRPYVPPHLRQSQGNPGAQGVVYHFPVPDGSSQYAPFTRVTADKISESPQPQAFIVASRSGIKPHEISHNAKQVRFADDQSPPSTKNPTPVKETRIESVARETQKPIVQHRVKQYQYPSSKGPKQSRISKLSMSERRGSKSSSEYSLPAEPINGGKKLGARAFANLNHAALRGDDEELLPTPGRRHKTPSLSPEPSITSSAPPSPGLFAHSTDAASSEDETTYNPDDSDSDMSSGPENLYVPRKTFSTASNSGEMDIDAVMRMPKELPVLAKPKKHKQKKAPRSNYTNASEEESEDSDEDLIRGRYMGKDQKREIAKFRPKTLFTADHSKNAQVSFRTTTKTEPMCFLRRARGAEAIIPVEVAAQDPAPAVGNQLGSGSGSGSGDTATVGGDGDGASATSGGLGSSAGTKRKRANCAGPPRIKRPYTWRDGGKRAKEAGVQAKILANKKKHPDASGDAGGFGAGAGAGATAA